MDKHLQKIRELEGFLLPELAETPVSTLCEHAHPYADKLYKCKQATYGWCVYKKDFGGLKYCSKELK